MSTVYTKLLGSGTNGSSTFAIIGECPVGFRWVVTDVVLWHNINQYTPQGMVRVYIDDPDSFGMIMQLTPMDNNGGGSYHWTGRQALDHPHSIVLQADDENWYCRVTGFELKLP